MGSADKVPRTRGLPLVKVVVARYVLPETVSIVVEALTKVVLPVTPRVELIVTAPVRVLVSLTVNVPPVLMLVLIVVAA